LVDHHVQCGVTVRCLEDVVPCTLEREPAKKANVGVILDEQYLFDSSSRGLGDSSSLGRRFMLPASQVANNTSWVPFNGYRDASK
jgi:hypothetical protein